jgi:hypothetical protein
MTASDVRPDVAVIDDAPCIGTSPTAVTLEEAVIDASPVTGTTPTAVRFDVAVIELSANSNCGVPQ